MKPFQLIEKHPPAFAVRVAWAQPIALTLHDYVIMFSWVFSSCLIYKMEIIMCLIKSLWKTNWVMCIRGLTQCMALIKYSEFTKLLINVDISTFHNFRYDSDIILYYKTWIYLRDIFLLYFYLMTFFLM